MRLVLIHGRAQGERTKSEIEGEWRRSLASGFEKAALPLPPGLEVRLPFYGARLDALTVQAAGRKVAVVGRNAPAAVDATDLFELDLIKEIADHHGVKEADALAEMHATVRERAIQNWEWVQALGRALSKRAPSIAAVGIAKFAADVNTYMTDAAVRAEIHDIVRAELSSGPNIIVSHSLGSIIGYWLLMELGAAVDVPLFVTLGSPLGVRAIKEKLPRPLGKPKGVRRWVNAADERDPIALHARLDRDIFPADIENASDVHNPRDNAHGIAGYLTDAYVVHRLHEAFTQN